MGQDRACAVPDAEVMASVDAADGGDRLVIADLTAEEAWVSTVLADAVPLEEWC